MAVMGFISPSGPASYRWSMGDRPASCALSVLAGVLAGLFSAVLVVFLLSPEPRLGVPEESFSRAMSSLMEGFASIIAAFLLLALVVWLFSALPEITRWRPWRYVKLRDEALETLRLRYARGEITKEQYLEMRRVLQEEG